MKSMTGYGKGAAAEGLTEVAIEIRAVNGRFLDLNIKLPKSHLSCEEYLRGVIPKIVKRGTVDVFFSFTADKEEGLDADLSAIRKYFELAQRVESETGVPNDLTFTALIKQDLIVTGAKKDDPELVLRLTALAAEGALTTLDTMRTVEGEAICEDFRRLIDELSKRVAAVAAMSRTIAEEYRAKLSARITEILDSVMLDEARLINEVAFFADKSDINEELQRLTSHIGQFLTALDSEEPAGRKLDFICQEIGREINTLGSKSNDLTITGHVVEMKNVLEKIREQVRNVE
ncbi:MAG: YicC family protein [Firmicutes bacterium]|nr:YicC family protein [Bacillota bacterium]